MDKKKLTETDIIYGGIKIIKKATINRESPPRGNFQTILWLYPNRDKPEPKRFHLIISECIINIQLDGSTRSGLITL